MKGRSWGLWAVIALGYAFLYVPILSVVFYSFNASRMATVWGGFSTRWYAALFDNAQIMQALGRSLMIAALAASFATVIGTASGLALSRFGRFPGRGLLSLMNRYVTVVVRSRMASLDDSLEEAAMDLGARPWRVFFVITLPLIAPALLAGWLLAFTLSLDDLVIASFTSGPGATTLPMLIYSKVKLGVTPEINALATLIVSVVGLGVLVAGVLLHRREKTRAG